MMQDLIARLNEIGKPTEVYHTPDGTRLLILPYGGRLLGLFAPDSEENFLWTNPLLNSAASARAYYESSDWQNSGGDRTWLAPELDFFFPDFPNLDLERYWQPRTLDPGSYSVVQAHNGIKLVNRLKIEAFRSKRRMELEIVRSFLPAPNPLRYDLKFDSQADEIEYAGHTLLTSLRILDPAGEDAPLVGLWSLTQMPHKGELFIPTYFKSVPRVYFGLVNAPDDLVTGEHLIRFKMRAAGEHKIGVRALATTGRIGYVYPTGNKYAAIIRNFSVNPSAEYADVPWREPEDRGYSAQACSVNSKWGEFSELEYHVPAIGRGTGRDYVEDYSQLWAFRGTRSKIERIAQHLLSDQIELSL
jgi:hypothetical protein